MVTYIALSVIWAVAGFAVGYAIGRGLTEIHEIRESVVEDRDDAGQEARDEE